MQGHDPHAHISVLRAPRTPTGERCPSSPSWASWTRRRAYAQEGERVLVTYLDSIDERLLDYLDEDDELRPEVVKRLRYYASALMEGSMTPSAATEDWADWFDLVGAFVAAHAPEGTEELVAQAAPLMPRRDGRRHQADSGRRTPSKRSSTPTTRCGWGSGTTRSRERLAHGVGEVGDAQVQEARRGEVGVTPEPLDDMDVHAAAQQARGVGVASAVREVAPRHPCPVPARWTTLVTVIGR